MSLASANRSSALIFGRSTPRVHGKLTLDEKHEARGGEVKIGDRGDKSRFLDGVLHCDDGPAITGGGEDDVFIIHGIRVVPPAPGGRPELPPAVHIEVNPLRAPWERKTARIELMFPVHGCFPDFESARRGMKNLREAGYLPAVVAVDSYGEESVMDKVSFDQGQVVMDAVEYRLFTARKSPRRR